MTPIGWDLCDENGEIEGLNRSKYGDADIADWDFTVCSVKMAKTNAKMIHGAGIFTNIDLINDPNVM